MVTVNNKIHLAGNYRKIELPAADATAIKPGMLLERTATAVQEQQTQVSFAEKMFALEDALQGRLVSDVYLTAALVQAATGDTSAKADPVQIGIMESGCLIMAWVKAGTNYTIGTKLFSSGTAGTKGGLQATTGSPVQCIAVCEQNLDLSASGTLAQLCMVRIV